MADKESSDTSFSSSQASNPLSRKLNKILETRLDNDKEMLEALKALSVFFSENSLRTRRNLRSDIERRSLVINEDFLQVFQSVKEQLDSVYNDVKSMNECCQDMTSRLKAAKEQTHDLINQTTKLQSESQTLQVKAQVADAFLEKFQLKPEEATALRGSRDGTLHMDFFRALGKAKEIHKHCKILLRTNQQTAGLEIMETMALHQESAYERLYRWAQNECRMLTGDSPDVSSMLCQAMEALEDRPVLFRYTLDEFGTARRTAVVRGLIDALTRGGPGGTPRPIELHSHDPTRYVGDMLAWLHQAAASEKEQLQSLLKKCRSNGEQIQDILGHITEGVCRPFKVRVEQVLVSEQDAVTLYKLHNLLKFYHNTICQIICKDAALLNTVAEIQDLSHRMFFNSLNCNANKLLDKVELPPSDLGPTNSLNQTLQLLKDVLACHDASVVAIDDKKQDYKQILSCVIDPLVQMCSVSASRLNSTDMAAYMANCIYLMQTTLAMYEFTDTRLEMLQAQVDAQIDTLVSEQASFVLNKVGLAFVYGTVQQHQPKQGPLSALPDMGGPVLKSAMSKFDSYMASPDSLVLPQSRLLLSGRVRETVKKNSADLICSAYKQIYDTICDPANEYKESPSIVPRTPDQVVRLLS
ncbi:conserved oligomeric Golgi complex subunit 6-like [Mizuhopecten yessoensis]|uniref:Conserved oligomeric Golgi complex subunit 6 n=1 Tax=Mizuhopecten yessoensis TaxID=6573 RepID=A0A210PS42_MIZYE|nr:conserved oligomeric Golgi complex subunit 6-like [Mizuhopecten yessoensis]OWF39301.1 Conserved oligomeric Golgi complex subunit 6 [Mizuhopecten yessoensis]